jgi:hypothetical protein
MIEKYLRKKNHSNRFRNESFKYQFKIYTILGGMKEGSAIESTLKDSNEKIKAQKTERIDSTKQN